MTNDNDNDGGKRAKKKTNKNQKKTKYKVSDDCIEFPFAFLSHPSIPSTPAVIKSPEYIFNTNTNVYLKNCVLYPTQPPLPHFLTSKQASPHPSIQPSLLPNPQPKANRHSRQKPHTEQTRPPLIIIPGSSTLPNHSHPPQIDDQAVE